MPFKKILIFLLSILFSLTVSGIRSFERPAASELQKKARVIGPQSAKKAQKKQDAKERKKKKDSKKAVKEFQNHALEIQSPEVRERIKQNRKNSNSNYNTKKKNNTSRTRNAGKKYR